MKHKSLIVMAAAIIAAVSCTHKVSDVTAVTGIFESEAPETVNIVVPSAKLDTVVAVTNGKFSVVIPAFVKERAMVKAGNVMAHFISDGTPLTMTFKADNTVDIVSKYPEISVQTRLTDYDNTMKAMLDSTKAKLDSIQNKGGEEASAIISKYQSDVKDFNLKTITENKNNLLTIKVLNNIQYDLNDNQLDSLMATLDPSLDSVATIVSIKTVLASKKATAEGKMFTDFEVNGSKLSDYVGKGKYMLVDFWASWCGPCKREIPNIKNVYEKYAGDDFDVLSVAVWDKPQSSIDTAKVYGVSWNEMVGDNEKTATDIYGIQGIPHIILFGPDGTILKRDLRGEDIEAEIAKHVQPKK